MPCMCVRMYVRRSYQKSNRLSRLVLFFYFDSVNNKNNILTTQPPTEIMIMKMTALTIFFWLLKTNNCYQF